MSMPFRQWFAACTSSGTNRMEGLCGRLRDAVQEDDDDDDKESIAHKSALWKDLTLSVLEPTVPREISVPRDETSAAAEDGLVGLEILQEYDPSLGDTDYAGRQTLDPWRNTTAECSWTYSSASSHGKDNVGDFRFDDGSSYSSAGGKPPRPTPPRFHKSHKKTISSGTTATVSTASRSRTSTWGSM